MHLKLIQTLQKEPSDRNKKDLAFIEVGLKGLDYFDKLYTSTKRKIFNIVVKGVAENATVIQYNEGHLIWKEDEKQEKIMILLDGEVQELFSLNQEELQQKRTRITDQILKSENIFSDKPGRRVIVTYEKNHQLSVVISEQPRIRRSQFFEAASQIIDLQQRSTSIGTRRYSKKKEQLVVRYYIKQEVPTEYLQQLSVEVNECFRGVYLQNEFQFKYLFDGLIFKMKQGNSFKIGQKLNFDISLKKHPSTLFTLKDCSVLQMNIKDYLDLKESLKLLKYQKIQNLLEQAFLCNLSIPEECNIILKVLMEKYQKMTFTSQNLVYNSNQRQIFLYVITKGEFQLSYEFNNQNHRRSNSEMKKKGMQEAILARVGAGSLLGEESFGLDDHYFKCTSISSICKVIGIRISDLNQMFIKFPWFKESLLKRQKTKFNWLQSRFESQQSMDLIHSERKHHDEQYQMKNYMEQRESQIINKFSKLKPKRELTERDIDQIVSKKEELMIKQAIFDNQILKGLPRKNMNNVRYIEEPQITTKEQSRKLLIKKISQNSQGTLQTQRDLSRLENEQMQSDLIPKLMQLDKEQCLFLKHMMNKISIKQLITPQEYQKPSAVAQLFDQRLDDNLDQSISPFQIRSLGCTKNQVQTERWSTINNNNANKYHTLSRLRVTKRTTSQLLESKSTSNRTTMRMNESQMMVQNGINQFPTMN